MRAGLSALLSADIEHKLFKRWRSGSMMRGAIRSGDSMERSQSTKLSIVLILLFVVSMVAIGCAQQRVYQEPVTGGTDPSTGSAAPVGGTAGPDVDTTATPNPAVIKLLERNGQVKSYSFSVANLPDRRGGPAYYVKGDNVRVEPTIDFVKTEKYDIIYLNLRDQTAIGYCLKNCETLNQAVSLTYADWAVPLPLTWIEDMKYGEIIGSLTYFNKPVTRVKYQKDGEYYEVYVDNYFGYPQRVAIATDKEMTNIIGGYEYRSMAFNSLKDTDVVFTPKTV
jgi:hypothetical protein